MVSNFDGTQRIVSYMPYSQIPYREMKKKEAKEDAAKNESPSGLLMAFEALPQVRRVVSVDDKIEHGEITAAIGAGALALINLPEDCRDVKSAYKQLEAKVNGQRFSNKYNYRKFQHDFSFFRGTMIEKWLHEKAGSGKKWATWLCNNDKTLADTQLGQAIARAVNVQEGRIRRSGIKNFRGRESFAFEYTGTKFAELTARAMRRTTKLGLCTMALLEVPRLFGAVNKGDTFVDKTENTAKQIVKSSANIAITTAGIGYLGAIGHKKFGSVGSLLGMGFGALLGNYLSGKVQKVVD